MTSKGHWSGSTYDMILGWLSERPIKVTFAVSVIVALSVWHIVAG